MHYTKPADSLIGQERVIPRKSGALLVCKVIGNCGGFVHATISQSNDPDTSSGSLNYTTRQWGTFAEYKGEPLPSDPILIPREPIKRRRNPLLGKRKLKINYNEDRVETDVAISEPSYVDDKNEAQQGEGNNASAENQIFFTEPDTLISNSMYQGIPVPTDAMKGLEDIFMRYLIQVRPDDFIFYKNNTLRLSRKLESLLRSVIPDKKQIRLLHQEVNIFLSDSEIGFIDNTI